MIEIRPARPDDLPNVSRLAAALVRLHHKWDPKRFMLVEPLSSTVSFTACGIFMTPVLRSFC